LLPALAAGCFFSNNHATESKQATSTGRAARGMDVRRRQESKQATQDGGGVTANKERAEALNNQKGEFPRPSSLEALPAKPLKAKD
jgi:hypothetical protein